jgi:hypothetical protein
MMADYARERAAAGRDIPPDVSGFLGPGLPGSLDARFTQTPHREL